MERSFPKKIIIIGAGIAGLAACKQLNKYGFEVEILEARDHVGGRICTNDTLGIPLGEGATWIHGVDNNPIALLAEEYHAKMVCPEQSKFMIFNRKGQPIPQNEIQQFNQKFDELLDQAKKLAYCSQQDISLATALSMIIKPEQFSPLEADLFKSKLRFFEGYIGMNYEFLSARHWDQEEPWPGENCFLTSGYKPIIDGLQKNCSIRLNSVVKKISIQKNNIEIETDDAKFYADAVIVTVPLGVLKKNAITFEPPLPSNKLAAIKRLEMGLLNITAIKFKNAFWPKQYQFMFFTQFDDLSVPAFFNLHHFIKEPILVGYSGGETARQLENFSDEDLIDKIMFNFKKVFGSRLSEPECYLNSRWDHDPFSFGSYSCMKVGSSGDDYETMAKPVSNRIFFAGEATSSKYPATTHGAYLSGIREAEKIKVILL